jgi:hypothetical protein
MISVPLNTPLTAKGVWTQTDNAGVVTPYTGTCTFFLQAPGAAYVAYTVQCGSDGSWIYRWVGNISGIWACKCEIQSSPFGTTVDTFIEVEKSFAP